MKMELRDATPELIGLKPNIDLRLTQLVTVSFEQSVSEFRRSDVGTLVTKGYEEDSIFSNNRGITEWEVSRSYGVKKNSETGFLRGFPVFESIDSTKEERGIELFFDYTDIYGSSLTVSLRSLRSLYFHSEQHSSLEALKHDSEVSRNITSYYAQIYFGSPDNSKNTMPVSYELLDAFIDEAKKMPKEKIFDYDVDKLDGAYVSESPTGLMVVKQNK